jgi:GT2 family glycosyltransferase
MQKIQSFKRYSASYIKDIFIKANGFSTEYPIASGEDFDLAFNIRNMGYDLVFTGETFVYHYHPDSLKKYLVQQFGRGYWRVKIYLRNKDKIIKGDSYTGHEAQVQFVLSGLVFLSIPLAVVISPLFLLCFVVLLLSNLSLGLWTFKKERKFIFLAPLLASRRSLVGTFGVFMCLIRNFSLRKKALPKKL